MFWVPKGPLLNFVKDSAKVRIWLVLSIEMAVAEVLNMLSQQLEAKFVFGCRDTHFSQGTKEENVVFPSFTSYLDLDASARIVEEIGRLTLAPSQVPIIKPPLSTNFILLVPLASVPAVEMCSLMSDAGQIISALLTL